MYRVTKKFDKRGPEMLIGNFNDEAKAKQEIEKRLNDDVHMLIKGTIYCLYEGFDLMYEVDQSSMHTESSGSQKAEETSGGGKGSGQSFRPSPLQTAPRPKGTPPTSWTRPEEDEDEDKK